MGRPGIPAGPSSSRVSTAASRACAPAAGVRRAAGGRGGRLEQGWGRRPPGGPAWWPLRPSLCPTTFSSRATAQSPLPASRGFPTSYSPRSPCLSIWDPRPSGVVLTCPGLSVCLRAAYVTSAVRTGQAPPSQGSRQRESPPPTRGSAPARCSLGQSAGLPPPPDAPPFLAHLPALPAVPGSESQRRLGQEVGSLSALDHDT